MALAGAGWVEELFVFVPSLKGIHQVGWGAGEFG